MNKSEHIGGLIEISSDDLLSNSQNESFLKFLSIPENNYLLTFSGRTALSIVFDKLNLKDGYIILPEYICVDSIYPLLKKKNLVPIRFQIGGDFEQELSKILEEIKKIKSTEIKAIILCNYFGSRDPVEASTEIKKLYPNIPLILDSVQDLAGIKIWKERTKWADWQIYSFKKSLPIPDGGILIGSGLNDINLKISSEATYFSQMRLKLATIRGYFLSLDDENPDKTKLEEQYLGLLSSIKSNVPNSSQPITKFSEILISKIDIEKAIFLRNRNYRYFYEKIKRISFIESFKNKRNNPGSDFFPIIVKNISRNKLKSFLEKNNVFCPIHWEQTKSIYKEISINSQNLSDNIISIPIDQRYNFKDMDRIIDLFQKYSVIKNN